MPADRRLPMPARPPEQIPQPSEAANRHQPPQPAAPVKRPWWEVPVMALSALATLGLGGISLLLTLSTFITDEAEGDEGWLWGVIVACWLLTVILALPIVLLRRRRR